MKRRRFLTGLGAGLAGVYGFASPKDRNLRRLSHRKAVETMGTARNLIFIFLEGAPSHVDTFDLKPGPYTPNFLGVQPIGGNLKWPSGTMPKLANKTDQFSIMRSISAVEAVHERAAYHLFTAHRQNAALIPEIPHFASILSLKFKDQRQPSDSLPTLMVSGTEVAKNGFLPIEHLGLKLSREGTIQNIEHLYEGGDDRFDLLTQLQNARSLIDDRQNQIVFQKQARGMMLDEELKTLLGGEEDDGDGSEMDGFLKQCKTAANVIAANKGTRVFQLQLGGWDHHVGIYDEQDGYGLASLSRAFDEGFSFLLDDLAARPGNADPGKTLLDETLIVAAGEFGRTTGRLNTSQGRDHYPYVMPALFAGGGIQPGNVIGSSSSDGSYITDPGWSQNRYIGINDVMATIYSALGVDWTERFLDTPSGRVYEIVDTAVTGPAYAVTELFA